MFHNHCAHGEPPPPHPALRATFSHEGRRESVPITPGRAGYQIGIRMISS